MLAKLDERNLSLTGIIMGVVTGALLGAIVSVILMALRNPDDREGATAGISNYVRLGIAMLMLVRQTSELIVHRPKQA
jgi:ABC-type Fe3+-siderophore transport system permease subunit